MSEYAALSRARNNGLGVTADLLSNLSSNPARDRKGHERMSAYFGLSTLHCIVVIVRAN